jgi:tetratricopeptide (TPR) repeat protein
VLLPAASLFFPWLAARETKVAISEWHADPAGAFDRLERARAINPLSDEPDVVAAIIASELGDEKRQEEALRKALERNPTNWYPMVELAALETRRSHSRKAFAWLDRAEKLNPREPTIAFIRQQIGLGRAVSSEMLQRMWVDQASLLTGHRQQW